MRYQIPSDIAIMQESRQASIEAFTEDWGHNSTQESCLQG